MTVKVSQDEAQSLRLAHGSPAKGIRALLDQSLIAPARAPKTRPGGRCRIHRNWSEPEERTDRGTKTITKTCQDCGYVATNTKPA